MRPHERDINSLSAPSSKVGNIFFLVTRLIKGPIFESPNSKFPLRHALSGSGLIFVAFVPLFWLTGSVCDSGLC
jgi:hypothetical protein